MKSEFTQQLTNAAEDSFDALYDLIPTSQASYQHAKSVIKNMLVEHALSENYFPSCLDTLKELHGQTLERRGYDFSKF